MHHANIIQDARTAKTSEHSIQESIVSGVMYETGLPKINNILHGVSKAHMGGHPMTAGSDGGKHPSVLTAPKGSKSATHQKPGTARYLASQSRRG